MSCFISPRLLRTLLALFAAFAVAANAFGYGPIGHQIVGAIADERLGNSPTGVKLRSLLQGYTLEKAAVIPDEIKGWDKKGVDDPGIFRYSSRPRLDAELADFWRANPPTKDHHSPIPSHHWFHYTDVPVLNPQRYADGKAGRSEWDIVQMMKMCVAVLEGALPEDNPRKITKTVAVILLAHFIGDIHQPLHVGAQYFNAQGQPVDPDKGTPGAEDQGGNTIRLNHTPAAAAKIGAAHSKLHGFWDTGAVKQLLPQLPPDMPKEERKAQTNAARRALMLQLAKEEPKNWRPPANVKPQDYAELWANEILPVAREAHNRLQFSGITQRPEGDSVLAVGQAQEKPAPDGVPYHEWAAKTVRQELHKAGWRLADLLEKSLK